ncbi:cytoskeletal protein RodZ [Streptomyces sp. SAI-229]
MRQYGPTMRRGLVHVLAWLLATGAAVTLSWWGVSTVMEGTAYDPPRALPIAAAGEKSQAVSSSTRRPAEAERRPDEPAKTRKPSAKPDKASSPAPDPKPSRTATPPPSPSPSPAAPAASGQVKGYDTKGGRAVFDLGETSASLVSATPGAGWSMQVWKTESWIRVEFTSGADRVSVFCTWHDGPPRVEIGTY